MEKKAQEAQSQAEKQKLLSKKQQYAKYVKEIILPSISHSETKVQRRIKSEPKLPETKQKPVIFCKARDGHTYIKRKENRKPPLPSTTNLKRSPEPVAPLNESSLLRRKKVDLKENACEVSVGDWMKPLENGKLTPEQRLGQMERQAKALEGKAYLKMDILHSRSH